MTPPPPLGQRLVATEQNTLSSGLWWTTVAVRVPETLTHPFPEILAGQERR